MENIAEDWIQIVVYIASVPLLIAILYAVTAPLNQAQCKPYQDKISTLEGDIGQCNSKLSNTESRLNDSEERYNRLLRENITKKDIEDLKWFLNETRTEVYFLKQDFKTLNSNVNKNYHILYSDYRKTLTITITLFSFTLIDIMFSIFNVDIKRKIINKIINISKNTYVLIKNNFDKK